MSSNKNIKFKCPFCDRRFTRIDLVTHVDENHDDMIPEGFTAMQLAFNYVNRKPLDYHGKCTECKGPTKWDENKGRYDRQCGNPKCRESYLKRFEDNMMRTKGVTRISSTAEGQEKMLANRKISGSYKFQNGVEKTYTGSYELKALEFMDKVLNINPDDILCPGPVLEYTYKDTKHMYITDFYYIPYNLVIEVKDGGKNPNKRDMPDYRGKQIAKEEFIIKKTNYNYLRLTDNDLSQLMAVFADLKMQMVEETGERVIHVNEAMNALMSGFIPGMRDSGSSYVVNYMQNNVFSGEEERGYGISDNIKLTNLITRDKEGKLNKCPDNFLNNCKYDVFEIKMSPEEVSSKLEKYIGEFVSESFLYESLFGKKMYTYDQIYTEESAVQVDDFYYTMNKISEATREYILTGNFPDNKHKDDKIDALLYSVKALASDLGIDDKINMVNESEDKSKLSSNFKKKTGENFRFIDFKDSSALNYMDKSYKENAKKMLESGCTGEIAINSEKKFAGQVYVSDENVINDLEVIKEFRGYGVGEQLLKDAIHKYKGDSLWVEKDNEVAINLYKKYGFVQTCTKGTRIGMILRNSLSESYSDNKKYYHLSLSNLDKKTLQPSIPDNFLTKNEYEENKTKRVCFSNSIDGCLRGLSQNLKDKEFYVHIIDDNSSIYKPTIEEVPDCKVTGEVWVKTPVKVKCIGKIHVIADRGEDGIPYKYGNKTAELYDWNWEWISKF